MNAEDMKNKESCDLMVAVGGIWILVEIEPQHNMTEYLTLP